MISSRSVAEESIVKASVVGMELAPVVLVTVKASRGARLLLEIFFPRVASLPRASPALPRARSLSPPDHARCVGLGCKVHLEAGLVRPLRSLDGPGLAPAGRRRVAVRGRGGHASALGVSGNGALRQFASCRIATPPRHVPSWMMSTYVSVDAALDGRRLVF